MCAWEIYIRDIWIEDTYTRAIYITNTYNKGIQIESACTRATYIKNAYIFGSIKRLKIHLQSFQILEIQPLNSSWWLLIEVLLSKKGFINIFLKLEIEIAAS